MEWIRATHVTNRLLLFLDLNVMIRHAVCACNRECVSCCRQCILYMPQEEVMEEMSHNLSVAASDDHSKTTLWKMGRAHLCVCVCCFSLEWMKTWEGEFVCFGRKVCLKGKCIQSGGRSVYWALKSKGIAFIFVNKYEVKKCVWGNCLCAKWGWERWIFVSQARRKWCCIYASLWEESVRQLHLTPKCV